MAKSERQRELKALVRGGFNLADPESCYQTLSRIDELSTDLRPNNPLLAQIALLKARLAERLAAYQGPKRWTSIKNS